jgi:tRNA A22 N-methylase
MYRPMHQPRELDAYLRTNKYSIAIDTLIQERATIYQARILSESQEPMKRLKAVEPSISPAPKLTMAQISWPEEPPTDGGRQKA